jgi:hypothetical protein
VAVSTHRKKVVSFLGVEVFQIQRRSWNHVEDEMLVIIVTPGEISTRSQGISRGGHEARLVPHRDHAITRSTGYLQFRAIAFFAVPHPHALIHTADLGTIFVTVIVVLVVAILFPVVVIVAVVAVLSRHGVFHADLPSLSCFGLVRHPQDVPHFVARRKDYWFGRVRHFLFFTEVNW